MATFRGSGLNGKRAAPDGSATEVSPLSPSASSAATSGLPRGDRGRAGGDDRRGRDPLGHGDPERGAVAGLARELRDHVEVLHHVGAADLDLAPELSGTSGRVAQVGDDVPDPDRLGQRLQPARASAAPAAGPAIERSSS